MKSLLISAWKILSLPKNLQIKAMRMTQDEFLIGVTGVILNAQKQILVCKHTYRGKSGWSLPGGYLKGKEHPKEGLAREIEEETGFIVRVDKQLRLRTDRETARIDISLIGSLVGGEFKASDEVSIAEFFEFEKLPLLRQDQLVLIKEVLADKPKISAPIEEDIKRLSFWERAKFLMKGGEIYEH